VPEVLGGGYGYMQFALQDAAGMGVGLLLLSLGKILAISLTISFGGSGGLFAPSLSSAPCSGQRWRRCCTTCGSR
jgi:CIC family chloride channel protein